MGLHNVKSFGKFVLGLKAATLHAQWEAQVAKVGGKVFALIGDDAGWITFKVTELSFAVLTDIEGISQAPYFAKGGWVSVEKGADLPDADLKGYLAQSHRLVGEKLTRKAKAELGLEF